MKHSSIASIAVAVFLAISASAEPRLRADETDIATLPNPIRDALDRASRIYEQPLKSAKWSKAQRSGDAHPVYQLRGTNGRGHTIEMEVTSAGRIIEVEEHGIPIGEVPVVVVETLKAKIPHFKPKQIEAIYQTEQPKPVAFGFEGEDPAGRKIEVYISADGKSFLN